jgi:DNA-directed RNA polymerase subunit RPC12/RpoP
MSIAICPKCKNEIPDDIQTEWTPKGRKMKCPGCGLPLILQQWVQSGHGKQSPRGKDRRAERAKKGK